jgi:hypothetical protein
VTSGGVGATFTGCPPHPSSIAVTKTAPAARHPHPRLDPETLNFMTPFSPQKPIGDVILSHIRWLSTQHYHRSLAI